MQKCGEFRDHHLRMGITLVCFGSAESVQSDRHSKRCCARIKSRAGSNFLREIQLHQTRLIHLWRRSPSRSPIPFTCLGANELFQCKGSLRCYAIAKVCSARIFALYLSLKVNHRSMWCFSESFSHRNQCRRHPKRNAAHANQLKFCGLHYAWWFCR